jgi:methionyl-tRNA formyltransferase
VFAGTGSAPVELGDVQQAGKRPMPARDWARGLHAGRPGQTGPGPVIGVLR